MAQVALSIDEPFGRQLVNGSVIMVTLADGFRGRSVPVRAPLDSDSAEVFAESMLTLFTGIRRWSVLETGFKPDTRE